VVPLAGGCGLLLAWLVVGPWVVALRGPRQDEPAARDTALDVAAAGLTEPVYRCIGVALDHSARDKPTLRHAAALARRHGAELVLLHIVEGVGGQVFGQDAADRERRMDQAYLEELAAALRDKGVPARPVLRFGNPPQELSRAVNEDKIDLLVLGSHGHGTLADWLFGETTGAVRHAVRIPVLIVREQP